VPCPFLPLAAKTRRLFFKDSMFLLHFRKCVSLIITIFVLLISTNFMLSDAVKVLAEEDAPFSKIAFISRQGQTEALHVIDPVTAKEDTFSLDSPSITWGLPAWSPQCNQLLIDRDVNNQKFVNIVAYGKNGLSTDLPEIASKELIAYAPRWSPDGDSIAFQALDWNHTENNADIYTLSVSTGELKNLTNDSTNNIAPSWSSDGKQIVFASMSEGNSKEYFDIYMVNADGSSLKTIYADPETNDLVPLWSPDGNFITFISQNTDGDRLMLVDKNGDTAISLTNNTTYRILHHSWSNDGKQIAFESADADDESQIFLLDVGSKSVQPLTDTPKTINLDASWSPDDSQLVFQSNRDGDFEIYTLDLASKTIRQLTHNDYDDLYPAWSPKSCSYTGYVYQGGSFDLNCPQCRVATPTP
jgi:Tol biopolymer transport system component